MWAISLECPLSRRSKGKVDRRTGQEDPEREKMYSFTVSLTSTLDVVGGQRHAPAPLPPENRPCTQRTGGWVGTHVENLAPSRFRSREVHPERVVR
jgi:hypothetical protein